MGSYQRLFFLVSSVGLILILLLLSIHKSNHSESAEVLIPDRTDILAAFNPASRSQPTTSLPTTTTSTTIRKTTTTTRLLKPKITSGPSEAAWAKLRNCEAGSSGGYRANTGNSYYGAYQFDTKTWKGLGYSGYPHQASPATQDEAARKLYASRGSQPWPVCGRFLH